MWWRWRSLSPPKDSFSQLVCLWEFGLFSSDMSEYLHMICVWKSTQCVFTIQPPFPCVWTPRSQPDTMVKMIIMRTMTMMPIMTMVGTLKGDPKTGPLEGPPCERANCNKFPWFPPLSLHTGPIPIKIMYYHHYTRGKRTHCTELVPTGFTLFPCLFIMVPIGSTARP